MREVNRERGFSLVMLSLTAAVMIGMMGLAIDLGRMFIIKNELQAFVDASALAAANQLDGTQSGLAAAKSTATAGPLGQTRPNGVNFDSTAITNVATSYATSFTGSYDSYATAVTPATNQYRFVKLTASAPVSLLLIPVIPGVATQMTLSASGVAGLQPSSVVSNGGLVPFAPDAHNATDTTNFGFTPGVSYTLKWGNGNTTTCAGDTGFNPGAVPSAHGFVDLGQGNSNNLLRQVIVYGGYPNANSSPSSVIPNSTWLDSVPGNRGASIFDATAQRSAQDLDQTSTTWAQYKSAGTGNGRRIITAPVVDVSRASGHGSNYTYPVIGFGNFLLDTADSISGTSGPICATYIGPASLTGATTGATDGTKVYSVNLYQ